LVVVGSAAALLLSVVACHHSSGAPEQDARPPTAADDESGFEHGCEPISTAPLPDKPEPCHELKCSLESFARRHPDLECTSCDREIDTVTPGEVCRKTFPKGWTLRCATLFDKHRLDHEIWCRPLYTR
jgi:hypothetical protein